MSVFDIRGYEEQVRLAKLKQEKAMQDPDKASVKDPWVHGTTPPFAVPTKPGVKHDAGKAPLVEGCLQRFPRAIAAVAEVSAYGKKKYGTYDGWETVPDAFNRYSNALGRHLVDDRDGKLDVESGLLQIAQTAWNALARLELFLREREETNT